MAAFRDHHDFPVLCQCPPYIMMNCKKFWAGPISKAMRRLSVGREFHRPVTIANLLRRNAASFVRALGACEQAEAIYV